MTDIRKSLFTLFSGTLLTFGVWLAICITVDPFNTDPLTIITFYSSLFLWLTGLFTFIFLYIRSHISDVSNQNLIPNSILHSSLIVITIIIFLTLQTLRVLGLLEGILLFVIFVLIELYIKAKTSHV